MQQAVAKVVSEFCDTPIDQLKIGIDGCGVPVLWPAGAGDGARLRASGFARRADLTRRPAMPAGGLSTR